MNKKLLYTALAAGLILPIAANAGAKIYGAAQIEINSYSDESGAPVDRGAAENTTTGKNATLEEDNARGRVGVKAWEDLGGGLKGIAKFEWKADTTDNDSSKGGTSVSLTPRESMVGLKGGFGTVMGGNLKSPYKYSGGVKYDIFVTTALEARRNGGMSGGTNGHNGFINKMIGYHSPKVNGLQLQLIYRLDEGASDGTGEAGGAYALAVKYSNGPISAFVAALDDDAPNGGAQLSYSATKVGAKFKSGAIAIMGQVELIDNRGTDETVIFVAGHYKMGKSVFVLQFANNDVDDAAGFDAQTYMAVGLVHRYTKKTRVFVGYRSSSDVENVVTLGMRKDFSS